MKNWIRKISFSLLVLGLAACGGNGGGGNPRIGQGVGGAFTAADGSVDQQFVEQMANDVANVGVLEFQPVANADQLVRQMMFPPGTPPQMTYDIQGVRNIVLFVDIRASLAGAQNNNNWGNTGGNIDQNFLQSQRPQFRALLEISDNFTDYMNITNFIHSAFGQGQVTQALANANQFQFNFQNERHSLEVVFNQGQYQLYFTAPGSNRQLLATGVGRCRSFQSVQMPMGLNFCNNFYQGY